MLRDILVVEKSYILVDRAAYLRMISQVLEQRTGPTFRNSDDDGKIIGKLLRHSSSDVTVHTVGNASIASAGMVVLQRLDVPRMISYASRGMQTPPDFISCCYAIDIRRDNDDLQVVLNCVLG